MISLPDSKILSFFNAWPWIISDRAAEFDDVLHRPVSSLAAAKDYTQDLVGKWELIQPEAPVSLASGYFKEMLFALEGEGEDILKIFDWARSISAFMQELDARRAMTIWNETFRRFAQGERGPANFIGEETLEELSESFLKDAFKPGLDFAKRVRSSERHWISNQERRSDFDNMLWDHFFSDYEVDPGSIVSVGYREILIREWWRIERTSLSSEKISKLRLEQIDNTKNFSKSRVPAWKLDDSIHEAMVVEGFPVFDTLRLYPGS